MPVVHYSFTPRARRELRRAPAGVARRIVEAIKDYIADARTGDVRKLAGVDEE